MWSMWPEMINNLLNGSQSQVQFQTNFEYIRGVTVSELEKFLRKVRKPLSWVLMLAENGGEEKDLAKDK